MTLPSDCNLSEQEQELRFFLQLQNEVLTKLWDNEYDGDWD